MREAFSYFDRIFLRGVFLNLGPDRIYACSAIVATNDGTVAWPRRGQHAPAAGHPPIAVVMGPLLRRLRGIAVGALPPDPAAERVAPALAAATVAAPAAGAEASTPPPPATYLHAPRFG